ncbi:WEB family protein At3g02930, chloroplastic-like [Phragmites australis]|uniref:WEB family protein At3g02930, chloroplastic-like n=1 Tax=Phragmites australis TaxID=29695 RepID=UPI002D7950DA|nr:WEB family protein At3g02930, chloroplastic-like [Phragmites australis]XP_062205549.1 WEB family protein At3g02930, chloroplastic-like [Phragmites australis]
MLPSRSRSGPYESPISKSRPSTPSSNHRPSTTSSNHRPSTPSSNHRPSTPGGSRRSSVGAPSTPRSRTNGGPFKSEPNSPPSAAQNARPRLSFDRSPRSADSRPVVERRVPKIGTPPDKQPRREVELQARLESVQEDLKKAKDQLAFIVGERDRLVGELNEAKRVTDETHEKLQDALMAKRWAEEATEIEKFRADELEQAGIDEAQRREEEWQREIECVRGQHAADLETLVNTTEELERLRRDLSMASEAKKAALGHADDAMKIAEVNAEKVEILSNEVVRLKGLLDSSAASEESKNRETEVLVKNLESEVSSLKGKLEEAKIIEGRLAEAEKLIEELKSEIADAQKAETDIRQQLEEWKEKAGSLEMKLEEVTLSEKFKSDSLASTTEELDKIQSILQDRESEIEVLKGKTTALEIEVARLLTDLNDTNEHLDASQQEVFGLQTTIDVLRNKLEAAEQAASEALNNEKTANTKIEGLTDEKAKLIRELNDARDREEKEKRAVEDLTAALNEASCEAQEAHKRFQEKEDDYEHALAQIGDLKMALKSTKESYEVMFDEASQDIACLRKTVEKLEAEVSKYREECESKELDIITASKQSEQEIQALKVEADQVVASLRGAEHELQVVNEEKERLQEKLLYMKSAVAEANEAVQEAKTEKERLQEKLMYTESVVAEANMAAQEAKTELERLQEKLTYTESAVAEADKAVQEAKAESLQLKERLLDKENALQSITQENDEFRMREADAMKKIDELSALLAEAMTKKHPEEEEKLVVVDEAHNSVREEDAPSVAENEDTEGGYGKKLKLDINAVDGDSNGDMHHEEKDGAGVGKESVKTEFTLQESTKVVEKRTATDKKQETESSNDELDSKEEDSGTENANGTTVSDDMSKVAMSLTKPQQQQKKNKPLLKKFGSLLKKKNSK